MDERNFSENRKNNSLKHVVEMVINGKTESDISEFFDSIGIKPSTEYEEGFKDKGFNVVRTSPKITTDSKKLRDYVLNHETDVDGICDEIISDIGSYIDNNIEDGSKHDIIYNNDTPIYDKNDDILIRKGDKIEVKHLSYTSDSYLSEFMAVGKGNTFSELFKTEEGGEKLTKYNELVGCLYDRINGNSDLIKRIIKYLMQNTKGIFFQDDIYVPISGLNFYISDRGMSRKEKRLTVRFRVKSGATLYKFNKVDGGYEVKEVINYEQNSETKLNHLGGNPPSEIVVIQQ
jgi:hypothetical protein